MRLEENPMRAEYCATIAEIRGEIDFLSEKLGYFPDTEPETVLLHQAKAAYLTALAHAFWPQGSE